MGNGIYGESLENEFLSVKDVCIRKARMDVEYDESECEIMNEFGTDSESENDEDNLFTEEQKTRNWLQVFNAIKFLENSERITEDWMEEQKYHILKWRDWIPNFSTMNSEITDSEFRLKCAYTEDTLQKLVIMIKETNTFDQEAYLCLLKSIEYIRASVTSVDDISDWLAMISVSSK